MKDPLVTLEGKASAAGALYKYMSLTSGFGMDGEGTVLLHSSQSKLLSMSLKPTKKLPGEVTGNEAVMLKRVQAVADSGAIEYIVVLCSGPDGPPPKPGDRPATASAGGTLATNSSSIGSPADATSMSSQAPSTGVGPTSPPSSSPLPSDGPATLPAGTAV